MGRKGTVFFTLGRFQYQVRLLSTVLHFQFYNYLIRTYISELITQFFFYPHRFFFKTACEDPDNPIIQEEIVNDAEILPLFEGKVMGLVKPFE